MQKECVDCFLEQSEKLLKKHRVNRDAAEEVLSRLSLSIDRHSDITSPEVACLMHRLIKRATCIDDPYKNEKKHFNDLLLSLEDDIRRKIRTSADPFRTALRFALAGNIIDFGPRKPFDALEIISEASKKLPYTDHTDDLKSALKKAETVLYLGDNTGEIVLDKLFIETIGHPNLYFAVRGYNIINDATLEDARYTGMIKTTKVISNGYDAPSTIVHRCSPEFRELYHRADVIISKGQGNLEGLLDETRPDIFFLLMVKCQVIAERIGVPEREVVVMRNQPAFSPA